MYDLETRWVWNKEDKRYWIQFLSEITFVLKKYHCEILIEPGFVCDGGSVPRFAWATVSSPYATRFSLAFILHDALYASEMFDRATCDKIFYELMTELNCPWLARNKAYYAVRAFGGFVWRKHNPETVEITRRYVRKFTTQNKIT